MLAPWTQTIPPTWHRLSDFIPWPFLRDLTKSALHRHHEGQLTIKRQLGFASFINLCGYPFGHPIHFPPLS